MRMLKHVIIIFITLSFVKPPAELYKHDIIVVQCWGFWCNQKFWFMYCSFDHYKILK